MIVRRQVGQRIRELREIQHYTREGFAAKIEMSTKYLYEIEAGRKGVSAEILSKIAVALSVSTDYILFGTWSVLLVSLTQSFIQSAGSAIFFGIIGCALDKVHVKNRFF